MKAQRQRLRRLNLAILLAFAGIGLSLVYWSTIRAQDILSRPDNPRLVEAELRIQRGRILDSLDRTLAETTGAPGLLERHYPYAAAAPAVGYYSLRHGTAGIEEGLDADLRGETEDWHIQLQRSLLHTPQVGRDVRLTLDAAWQQTAHALLGEQRGAVLLFTLSDSAIRVMVSHPTYDPNQLDSEFESLAADENAPLLNRATQGQYQPGLALQPFILAGAAATGRLSLDNIVSDGAAAVEILGNVLTCVGEPAETMRLADALRYACPAPMLTVLNVLQAADLQQIFIDFGLTSAPELPLVVETPLSNPPVDMRLSILGQENLTVTPLQVGVAWMALGNQGILNQPRLVAAITADTGGFRPAANGVWQTYTKLSESRQVVPQHIAAAILAALPRHENIIEHAVLALSGPGGSANGWYLALSPANDPQMALVVIIEETQDVAQAQQVGRALLDAVLSQDAAE